MKATTDLAIVNETREVVVHGTPCTLEKRVCEGGCRREFWVCPGSKAVHARSDCKYTCNLPIDQIPAHILQRFDEFPWQKEFEVERIEKERQAYARQLFSKSNPKTKPAKPEKPKPIIKDDDSSHMRLRRWNIAISRAKRVYERREYIPGFREAIAEIACAVITRKKKFSIKYFSILLGIDRKTLQLWIHVKYDIINAVSNYDGNFPAARKARERLRQAPGCAQELYDQEIARCQRKMEKRKLRLRARGSTSIEKSNGSSTIVTFGIRKLSMIRARMKFAG